MSANTLLITAIEVRKYTSLKGAVDSDYIDPVIKVAQDLGLAYVLGFNLMTKLQTLKEAGTVPTPYSTLLNTYVKPYMWHLTAAEVVDSLRIDLNNQGTLEKNSNQGTSVSVNEYNSVKANLMRKSDGYKKLLIEHLCRFGHNYPEYYTDQNGRQDPTASATFYGIDNF
jgi:hypothetical protein